MLSQWPMSMGHYIRKGDLQTSTEKEVKNRNLSSIGSYLLTQEGGCCSLQKTLKWGFPRSLRKRVADLATQEVALEPVGPLQVLVALPKHLEHTPGETSEQNKN